ncbi:glucokinase [soil metagenome]
MTELALVGDIGGTNSRFGLVELGSTTALDIEALKNDGFGSLEEAAAFYLKKRGIGALSAFAVAIAGPVTGETVSLTNRAWSFTRASLAKAANARAVRILNDFEALALSLPHLGGGDLVQIGGRTPEKPGVKIVLGPGTGLGMATLAPLPHGGWMALPGELGHITLPVATQAEFDLREAMSKPGVLFESEDAITGGGLLRLYRAITTMAGHPPRFTTPEDVLQAALAKRDGDAEKTLDQFVVWLARLAGDAAMTMLAQGGVYLAGGIAPSIVDVLDAGEFRQVFQEKGRLAHVMRPIPVYVITDRFPALKGCAAALAEK